MKRAVVSVVAVAALLSLTFAPWSRAADERAAGDPAGQVAVADGLRVVELFTSEGCSSCPPADGLLARLSKRDDVVVLGFHVDYWNRLGWKDRFSDAAWTNRQRQYAGLFKTGRVYTPQAIFGGRLDAVGSDGAAVAERLQSTPAVGPLDVSAVGEAGGHVVTVRGVAGGWVNAALVQRSATTRVPRGENAGQTLSHANVVRAFATAKAEGKPVTLRLSAPADVGDSFVVAFSQDADGTITAASVAESVGRP